LKAYIRIVRTPLPILIDIRVSICVISEDLAKKFRLKIEANDRIKIIPLEGKSKVRVIGLIPNVLIAVQNLCTSKSLYVIGGTKSVIILKTDWMDRYQADI